jgi:hypothetical protein
MKILNIKLSLIFIATLAASVASAAPITCGPECAAYSFATGLTTSDSNPLSVGFEFRTDQAVTISALGYFDYAGDGFSSSHEVGIFDSAGTLLAATTLNAGTGDTLIGTFRYKSIGSLLLGANQSFTIAATVGGASDLWAYGQFGTTMTGFSNNPAIQIAQDASRFIYTSGECLEFPTEHFRYSMYAGPNFLIDRQTEDVHTPEPGPAILLSSALGVLYLLKRKIVKA